MFRFFFSSALAATPGPIDATAISAATDACLSAVRVDFDGGDVLPSRAIVASTNAELCSKGPALAKAAIERDRDEALEDYRTAHARLDAAKKEQQRPALSGRVTVDDEWITSSLDRARASQAQEPESPDAAFALGAWADVERLNTQLAVLNAALRRVHEDAQRYFALRDALWMADCTGEVDLAYPETMPVDTLYTHEEQCRQLALRRNGSGARSVDAAAGNPGAARH